MIQVNDKKISYVAGMTVADAIEASGATTSAMTIVLVNGKFISLDMLNKTALKDEATIKLLMLISGG